MTDIRADEVAHADGGDRDDLVETLGAELDLASPSPRGAVSAWLAKFEAALTACDEHALSALFTAGAHHRDLLAFSWTFRPDVGSAEIARFLAGAQPTVAASGFGISEGRAQPAEGPRLGETVYEAIFEFETAVGRGSGVVRLPVADPGRACLLLTALDEIRGHEERVAARRPSGSEFAVSFSGPNWLDRRLEESRYLDRDPAVLVVGGGQGGLALAARLRQVGVDTLVVERLPRIGDNWRRRYRSLVLHNPVFANHLPYLPFPPTWPRYIPKDKLAGWLEYYAEAMELNCWVDTEFVRAEYDEQARRWSAWLRHGDGSERVLRPRHLVFANGVSGLPYVPDLPGLASFSGKVMHSDAFTDGSAWTGRDALVVGSGSSGHDVAQDLHSHGARTTMVQRGSTTVASVEPTAALDSALYAGDLTTEDCDLIASASTYPLAVRSAQAAVELAKQYDRDLLDQLSRVGFKHDYGEDESGHRMKARRYGGGYYLDVGCSGLIADGAIGLIQFDDVECFVPEGIRLRDGSVRPADLVVLATGYHSQQELVRRTLGDDVAARIGQVYGVGPDGEQANIWKATAQEGLWFTGGTLNHARVYSRYLALQILGREIGLV